MARLFFYCCKVVLVIYGSDMELGAPPVRPSFFPPMSGLGALQH